MPLRNSRSRGAGPFFPQIELLKAGRVAVFGAEIQDPWNERAPACLIEHITSIHAAMRYAMSRHAMTQRKETDPTEHCTRAGPPAMNEALLFVCHGLWIVLES
jgi:hypothetical protein